MTTATDLEWLRATFPGATDTALESFLRAVSAPKLDTTEMRKASGPAALPPLGFVAPRDAVVERYKESGAAFGATVTISSGMRVNFRPYCSEYAESGEWIICGVGQGGPIVLPHDVPRIHAELCALRDEMKGGSHAPEPPKCRECGASITDGCELCSYCGPRLQPFRLQLESGPGIGPKLDGEPSWYEGCEAYASPSWEDEEWR